MSMMLDCLLNQSISIFELIIFFVYSVTDRIQFLREYGFAIYFRWCTLKPNIQIRTFERKTNKEIQILQCKLFAINGLIKSFHLRVLNKIFCFFYKRRKEASSLANSLFFKSGDHVLKSLIVDFSNKQVRNNWVFLSDINHFSILQRTDLNLLPFCM